MSNFIIILGLIFLVLGLFVKIFENKSINIPLLPGDIFIKKENLVFYFPLTTSIIISLILSFILWLIFKK
ncbi:MAG: hypothetical protein KatS3mg095_0829 [Candidatus Parcubacteria bacterium]|nr:MAG: hypothetical protein KatS3mg095_0829 [Candidatus Parcubacteria bacterium]